MTRHFVEPPSLPMPTGEKMCRLCAESGRCCCITDPGLTHLSFPLSRPEWLRLLPYAELATLAPARQTATFAKEETAADDAAKAQAKRAARQKDSFCPVSPAASDLPAQGDIIVAAEPNHEDFIISMNVLFSGQRARIDSLFPPGGAHYSLRTRSDGACVFLGSSGCRLPRSVRPWYCLIFPAWITGGNLTLFLSPDCLISRQAKGPAHGLSLMDQPAARIRELHALLCRDWNLEPPASTEKGQEVT